MRAARWAIGERIEIPKRCGIRIHRLPRLAAHVTYFSRTTRGVLGVPFPTNWAFRQLVIAGLAVPIARNFQDRRLVPILLAMLTVEVNLFAFGTRGIILCAVVPCLAIWANRRVLSIAVVA
jgi:hypothetical protein